MPKNPDQADDLVQEACERVLKKQSRYEKDLRLESLLYRIIYNRWIDKLRRRKTRFANLVRMAAVVVLVMVGFGAGWLIPTGADRPAFTFPTQVPADYSRVIQEAMEYNLSGAPRQWQSPENQAVIIVTPVKTFRDKNGQYFREFHMEVSTATEQRQVNGLAYRRQGEWKTKAIYFQ